MHKRDTDADFGMENLANRCANKKLAEDIRQLADEGYSNREITDILGCSIFQAMSFPVVNSRSMRKDGVCRVNRKRQPDPSHLSRVQQNYNLDIARSKSLVPEVQAMGASTDAGAYRRQEGRR